jgi:hypothetical protein
VQVAGLGLHRELLLYLPRSPRSIVLDVSLLRPSAGEPQALHPNQASVANVRAMRPCSSITCLDLSQLSVTSAQVGAGVGLTRLLLHVMLVYHHTQHGTRLCKEIA